MTTKVAKDAFRVTKGSPKEHVADNGSTNLHREFCDTCGTGILEYGVRQQAMAGCPYEYLLILICS